MAVYQSLPVCLAIFLIGLSFSSASVAHLRKYNGVLHQVEDRVRSPQGPGKQGPPGDHGILVGPGGPPVGPGGPPVGPGGPGGFGPGVPGANGTSGVIVGPGGPGFLPISPTGEKCVSMCEKLEALIDSLEANMTESNVTVANTTDPDIPPVMFFVFLFCSNSSADGPLDQVFPGKSENSSEESGESEESSEESGESEDSSEESDDSEDSTDSSDDDDDVDRWISWDQLETKRRGRPGHFQKVCGAHKRLMNLQLIRQAMDNATLFNQSGPLQSVMGYVHDVCQKEGSGGEGNDGEDDDDDSDGGDGRMIRRGPHNQPGKDGKFDSWEGHPGPMGDPITEFCQIISIVVQPMGGNLTAPDGSEEVIGFFKDMVSCLCSIDLEK